MFSKILIANRGEIACRIMRTAKKMGIKTVAVYSDADAQSLHVDMADEAYYIGTSPVGESYLSVEKIIEVAQKSGVQAIHPGYGFLSENAKFCQMLEKANLSFIGPNAEAIRVMGDKIESKKYANQAGVNTIPGFLGEIKDIEHARVIANEIGYPVMIKASAGGGGKGMRIASDETQLQEGLSLAISEAKSSFGDERVFIEKYIEDPHHIEIQVLGDKHGHVIHLFERECSVQRRNQKVIEESPSPFIDDETRQKMVKQSIQLSQAVNYDSAGTIEFVVGKNKDFYFLEMNTRLQVEHPVTELVTGIDIVEHMILVASGEVLSLCQQDVRMNGRAMEARVYSENPYNNFLPSIGRIQYYIPPSHDDMSDDATLRLDTGIRQGSDISLYYDPMISKLCIHAQDRNKVIHNMVRALNAYCIEGVQHNLHFLLSIMQNKQFQQGEYTTHFIQQEYPDGFQGVVLDANQYKIFAVVAVYIDCMYNKRRAKISGRINDIKFNPLRISKFEDGQEMRFRLSDTDSSKFMSVIDVEAKGVESSIAVETLWKLGDTVWRGKINGVSVSFLVLRGGSDCYYLSYMGSQQKVWVYTENEANYARLMPVKVVKDDGLNLVCPMPGIVVDLFVEEGQEVFNGEKICTLEAMKMENVLRAQRRAKVKKIHCKAGDKLLNDDIIIEFEAIDTE